MTDTREDRVALSGNLEDPATRERFWDRVAGDVDWTAEGTRPLAGRYHGKKEFTQATFARPGRLMKDGVGLKLQHLYVDGDTTVVELLSSAITAEGAPFENRYCWVCRFEGDTIAEVRAYLDPAMVTYAVLRGEAAGKQD